MRKYDVVVVGAGPAGCSAAIKCANFGYSVLLLEAGSEGKRKPCAGVAPEALVEVIESELGLKLPNDVFSSPKRVGLLYVPPSGRASARAVRGYELLNLERDAFDSWLRREAKRSGAEVRYNTSIVRIRRESRAIAVEAVSGGETLIIEADYLIGADGVFSTVRSQLSPRLGFETMGVLQELWEAGGDFSDHFHMFFRGDVSPAYAYAVPKGDLLLVGVGAPPRSLKASMEKFKRWLEEEFSFKPRSLKRREVWAVPWGTVVCGEGRVILAGDAGGFCKPFVGEGIRLAVESGATAAEAIRRAEETGKSPVSTYTELTVSLRTLIRKMREFASGLATDEDREAFVKSELSRYFRRRTA